MAQPPEKEQARSETRRKALAFVGVDPTTGQERPIQLDFDKLKDLPRKGSGKVKEAGYIVPEVLRKPTAIFKGLKRDNDEPRRGAGALCYVGRPKQFFHDDGRSVPPPHDLVFMIFVSDEWIAYNWYWHNADATNSELPDGHLDRFEQRLI